MATKDQRLFLDLSLKLLSQATPSDAGDLPPGWAELVRELRIALYPDSAASTGLKRGRPAKSKAQKWGNPDEPNPLLELAKQG